MSLLEVVVALAIFLMALAAIGLLISRGGNQALEVQQQGQATQLCQAKLAEVIAGAVPLSGQSDVPFDEDPQWLWSLDAEQGPVTGLWNVTVRVARRRSEGLRSLCSLTQMVLDPSLRGSTFDTPPTPPDTPDSNSAGSTAGASSPSGSSPSSSPPAASGAAPKAAAPSPPASGAAPKAATPSTPAPSTTAPKTPTSPTPSTPAPANTAPKAPASSPPASSAPKSGANGGKS
jgi:hypothetical protein